MSYYKTLGLVPGASDEAIKTAYRALRSKHHPDRGGDKVLFNSIQKAYDGLSKKACSMCEGKGQIREKQGAFVRYVNCPKCWNILL